MKSERYVARLPDGTFVGSRRYSYSAGTTVAKATSLDHARLFSRFADADYFGTPLKVTVELVEE